jgi:SMC interacting uncharacterized protein involved in chromosome segregation
MKYINPDLDPLGKLEEVIVATNNNSNAVKQLIAALNGHNQHINLLNQQIDGLHNIIRQQDNRLSQLEQNYAKAS